MRILQILLIFSVLVSANIIAGDCLESISAKAIQDESVTPFERGMVSYQGREFENALQWFERAAGLGDVNAYLQIGLMFDFGQGVEQDFAEALRWYRRAAAEGDQRAMYLVGHMYEFGEGVPVDRRTAMIWYLKSAHLGYANAQYAVAMQLLKLDLRQDLRDEAIGWLQKAACQCHPMATLKLQKLLPGHPSSPTPREGC